MLKNQNGITLISLVITIIVMLIMAAVAISSVVGEGGVLGQAINARKDTNIGRYKEEINVIALSENMNYNLQKITFEEQVDKIEEEILKKDYVETVSRKLYDGGVVLEVKTDETMLSVDCREAGIDVMEGVNENLDYPNLYNYIVNENDEVEILGFDCSKIDYEYSPGYYSKITIKNMPTLYIPSKIDGKDVVKVKFIHHLNCNGYTGQIFVDGIYGIKKVIFPKTVKEIASCRRLIGVEEMILNEGVEILRDTCIEMTSLREITIPSSVKELYTTFLYCNKDLVINIKGKSSIDDFDYVNDNAFLVCWYWDYEEEERYITPNYELD